MRIIAGDKKGRKLKVPGGTVTRPTPENVKEAVFNIIQFQIENRSFLDLFAGSGQIGIEALSRGASEVVFVEEDKQAAKVIKDNLEKCGLKAQLFRENAFLFLSRGRSFDIIYLDPPFMSDYINKSIEIIQNLDNLNENGIIICESSKNMNIRFDEKKYTLAKQKKYGSKMISILKKSQ
jgi:16S rRNA (guanine966-N2)-methyltransferase